MMFSTRSLRRPALLLILRAGAYLALASTSIARVSAADINTLWLTGNGDAQIHVFTCGDLLCGRIAAIKDPIDSKTGKPPVDKNNPDPALRAKPIVGTELFQKMKPSGQNVWHGQIYNPEDGQSYDATVTLEAAQLKVRGCGLAGLICQTETWTPAQEAPPPIPAAQVPPTAARPPSHRPIGKTAPKQP